MISDAYGSVGDITFYHRGGKCYYRKRSAGNYPGTPGQLSHLDVHRRALAAWRTLDQATQMIWHEYGKEAVPHKPPFDNQAHISGQNLFVSAALRELPAVRRQDGECCQSEWFTGDSYCCNHG